MGSTLQQQNTNPCIPSSNRASCAVKYRASIRRISFCDAKRNYFLVVLNEETAVDLKQLRGFIGAKGNLSFASQEALREILGVEAGAVSAFAAINDETKKVQVVLEEGLLASERINGHPLVNHRTTSVTPEQLLRFLEGTGHRPVRVALG